MLGKDSRHREPSTRQMSSILLFVLNNSLGGRVLGDQLNLPSEVLFRGRIFLNKGKQHAIFVFVHVNFFSSIVDI